MTKWEAIAAGLSTGARSALSSAGSSRQGTRVRAMARVVSELADAGLVGAGNGLTQHGSIVRDSIVTQELDRMFG